MDGFVEFHLFRGATTEEATIYLSHTLWRDKAAFDGWAKSQNFRGSHKGVRDAWVRFIWDRQSWKSTIRSSASAPRGDMQKGHPRRPPRCKSRRRVYSSAASASPSSALSAAANARGAAMLAMTKSRSIVGFTPLGRSTAEIVMVSPTL